MPLERLELGGLPQGHLPFFRQLQGEVMVRGKPAGGGQRRSRTRTCGICHDTYDPNDGAQVDKHVQCVIDAKREPEGK